MIATMIPIILIQLQIRFYTFFTISYKLKIRIEFSASRWSGNEDISFFCIIANPALLQCIKTQKMKFSIKDFFSICDGFGQIY